MTDLIAENARLRAALRHMVNHAEWREENEGVYWEATKIARAALAAPAPDAAQEAARFLAEAIDKDMQTFNHSLTVVDLSPDMPVRHFFSRALVAYADTLRAIAGDKQ